MQHANELEQVAALFTYAGPLLVVVVARVAGLVATSVAAAKQGQASLAAHQVGIPMLGPVPMSSPIQC